MLYWDIMFVYLVHMKIARASYKCGEREQSDNESSQKVDSLGFALAKGLIRGQTIATLTHLTKLLLQSHDNCCCWKGYPSSNSAITPGGQGCPLNLYALALILSSLLDALLDAPPIQVGPVHLNPAARPLARVQPATMDFGVLVLLEELGVGCLISMVEALVRRSQLSSSIIMAEMKRKPRTDRWAGHWMVYCMDPKRNLRNRRVRHPRKRQGGRGDRRHRMTARDSR